MLSFYKFSHFQTHTSIIHAVTIKSNKHPYSFSLALHTGELTQSILENRQALIENLSSRAPLSFIVANQTHSSNIVIIDSLFTRGWNSASEAIEDCDALITNIPHVALTILTADCVPVLLYDPVLKIIAAIHAGWRGSQKEIVKKTIQKMIKNFGSNPLNIQAGIGPSIGKCCYEVDKKVAEKFSHIPHAFKRKKEGKYMLDLPLVNKQQLLESGLIDIHIELSNICTSCNTKHYFSYRKENQCSGRFMSLIALDK